jgi:hypothetical protein
METDDDDSFADAMGASNPGNPETGFQLVKNGKRQRQPSDEVNIDRKKYRNNAQTSSNNPEKSASVKGRAVIVHVKGTEDEKRLFVGKSLKLSKILNDSEFGKAGIEKVNVNFKNQSVTIILKSIENINNLLKVNKIGNYNVECTQPISHTQYLGVIKPIGQDTTVEEVMEALHIKPEQNNIIAERITKSKGTNKIPTLAIKLSFATKDIPEYVYLEGELFRVNTYVSQPYQCYNCPFFQHSAKNCKGSTKCLICSGPHKSTDCPRTAIKCELWKRTCRKLWRM